MSSLIKNGLDNMMFFLKRVFKKNNLMLNEGNKDLESENKVGKSRQFDNVNQMDNSIETMKAENRKKQITKEIIELVDKNPKALNYLNDEQLTFIDNYYVEDIKKLDESLKSIQKDIDDLDRLIELCKKMTA
jgi:hypothetical protein